MKEGPVPNGHARRGPAGLAEVAAGDGRAGERKMPERAQRGGDQVDGAAGALDPAVDEQRGRGGGRPPVAVPDVRRADDVQHPGLVLQAEEHHPARGRRPLPVGDQAGHGHGGIGGARTGPTTR